MFEWPDSTIYSGFLFFLENTDYTFWQTFKNQQNIIYVLKEKMKFTYLQIFWDFCGLVAMNPHVHMEVCQVNMTNNAREALQLRYSEWFWK